MGANNPNYQIISTDYTSFAVVYSCTNLLLAHLSKFLVFCVICALFIINGPGTMSPQTIGSLSLVTIGPLKVP